MKDIRIAAALFVVLFLLGFILALGMVERAGGQEPTPTYIQFEGLDMGGTRVPAFVTATPDATFYAEMPTPIPFEDMPILYYHDDEHRVGCWVTFNQMGISCLADPAEPPPCTSRIRGGW